MFFIAKLACGKRRNRFWRFLVPGTGFEPVTFALEGHCSIQLSYPGVINSLIVFILFELFVQ